MREFIVLSSLACVIVIYIAYSIFERSWFNVLTPQMFVTVPALYIAQLIRITLEFDVPHGVEIWAYIFACYVLPQAAFVLALMRRKSPKIIEISTRKRLAVARSPWVFVLLGFLLYLPVAIEYRSDLLNPRLIYEQTRTGYGLNFFVSSTLTAVGFILYLFKTPYFWRRLGFFALCALFSLAHGSKGQVLTLAMIWMIHWRYADGNKVSFARAGLLVGGMCVAVVSLFYFFSIGVEFSEIASFMAGYSDYTANAMMVIDADKPARFGELFFEDNFFSRIPRFMYADKPKDFGSYSLAKQYFPERFDMDQGVPAFGIGVVYADFKWLTLPILCVASYVLGLLTVTYRKAVAKFRHPGDFIVLCFLCSVPLLLVGVGFLLPEHLILSGLVTIALGFGRRRSRRARMHVRSAGAQDLSSLD